MEIAPKKKKANQGRDIFSLVKKVVQRTGLEKLLRKANYNARKCKSFTSTLNWMSIA